MRWVALGSRRFLEKLSSQGRTQQNGEEGKVFDLFANKGNERKKAVLCKGVKTREAKPHKGHRRPSSMGPGALGHTQLLWARGLAETPLKKPSVPVLASFRDSGLKSDAGFSARPQPRAPVCGGWLSAHRSEDRGSVERVPTPAGTLGTRRPPLSPRAPSSEGAPSSLAAGSPYGKSLRRESKEAVTASEKRARLSSTPVVTWTFRIRTVLPCCLPSGTQAAGWCHRRGRSLSGLTGVGGHACASR